MKRLEAAGLSQEKVAEVASKYKEMKRASMLKFLQERLRPQENEGLLPLPEAQVAPTK